MTDTAIMDALRGVEFFHDIEDEHLERLAEIAQQVDFPAHSEIFHEHELAKNVYVIIRGKVSLVICTPKVGCRKLMEVNDGELFGWSPLIGRARLTDTARTLTPTTAVALDGAQVLALCADDTEFGFEFMLRTAKALAQRLSATRLQLLEMSGVHLPKVAIESD